MTTPTTCQICGLTNIREQFHDERFHRLADRLTALESTLAKPPLVSMVSAPMPVALQAGFTVKSIHIGETVPADGMYVIQPALAKPPGKPDGARVLAPGWARLNRQGQYRCLEKGCGREAVYFQDTTDTGRSCEFHADRAGVFAPPAPAGSPDVLRTMTAEQLATFKPIGEDTINEAIRKGARDRAAAMGMMIPHIGAPAESPGYGLGPACSPEERQRRVAAAKARLGTPSAATYVIPESPRDNIESSRDNMAATAVPPAPAAPSAEAKTCGYCLGGYPADHAEKEAGHVACRTESPFAEAKTCQPWCGNPSFVNGEDAKECRSVCWVSRSAAALHFCTPPAATPAVLCAPRRLIGPASVAEMPTAVRTVPTASR